MKLGERVPGYQVLLHQATRHVGMSRIPCAPRMAHAAVSATRHNSNSSKGLSCAIGKSINGTVKLKKGAANWIAMSTSSPEVSAIEVWRKRSAAIHSWETRLSFSSGVTYLLSAQFLQECLRPLHDLQPADGNERGRRTSSESDAGEDPPWLDLCDIGKKRARRAGNSPWPPRKTRSKTWPSK